MAVMTARGAVRSSGRVIAVNEGGRAMLATIRGDVSQSILAALAHETGPLPVDLTALDAHGAPDAWLAVVHTRAASAAR
jgi:hypothetical protein